MPTAGNNIALDITLAATGAALGVLCALTTHLRRDADGVAFAWAGVLAAILWVVGIGCRMIFAFVMMALAEATARLVALRIRGRKLLAATPAAAEPATARALVITRRSTPTMQDHSLSGSRIG